MVNGEIIMPSSQLFIMHFYHRAVLHKINHQSRSSYLNLFFTVLDEKCEKFEVHKSILSARSEVFAAMLQSDSLTETKDNQMTIKDIKPDALKAMLRFLYTDQVLFII